MNRFSNCFQAVLVIIFLIIGCEDGLDLGPKPVSLSDTNITPMLKAIAAVDREKLGFTPIPTNANVYLEMVDHEHWKQEYPPPAYDAMLHVYAQTHRTVSFRKTPDGYRWTSEQESHFGPKMYTNFDGTFQEQLTIMYCLESDYGIPTNQIYVHYIGQDIRLLKHDDLTLEEIRPFLEEWKGTPIR